MASSQSEAARPATAGADGAVRSPAEPTARARAELGARSAPADERPPWHRTIGRRDVVAVGILLAAFALPLRGLMRYQGSPMEEGFMLVFPEQVLRGAIPNRDFLHLYGPGSLWVLAAVFKAFGTSLATERIVGLVQHMGIVFGVFALARPWGRRVATVCGLASLVIVLPPIGLTALAWNGGVAFGLIGLACGLWGLRSGDEGQVNRRLLLAGLIGAAALLYRPDMILAVGLGYGAMVWRSGPGRLRRLLTGLGVGLSAYLIQLAWAGPGHAINGMVLDPVFRLRAGRSLPAPPSWDHLDGFLQRAGGLRVASWPLPMLPVAHQVSLWFLLLVAAALFVAGAGWWRYRRAPGLWRSRVLLASGLFGLGLMPQALQRPDTTHLAWVSCVVIALVPVAVVELLSAAEPAGALPSGRSRRLGQGWAQLAGCSVVAVVLLGLIPFFSARTYLDLSEQTFGHNVFGSPIAHAGRNFYYGSQQAAADGQRLVNDLDRLAKPGQRLLVGPVDLSKTTYSEAFFYFLFPKLTPATYYIEMDPGVANRADSGLADEVAHSDWLILSNVWSAWDEPNDSTKVGSAAPNLVRDRHFCQVGQYGTFFQLWRRCR